MQKSAHNSALNLLTTLLRWLLPVALTVLLVWWLFSKVSFSDMVAIVRDGCNYWWILLAMTLSILSHVVRAARYRLQLNSLGIKAPFMAICCSIFGTYALNLIFPRLGELWRCTYIQRVGRQTAPLKKEVSTSESECEEQQERKPKFTTVFGSMLADRLADSASVLVLILLTFIVATPAISAFLDKYPVGRGVLDLVGNPLLWSAIVAVAFIAFAMLRIFSKSKFVVRLKEWVGQLWQGFADVARMPRKGMFLLLTAAIWGCYYIQLYVAFFAFPFTADLCTQASLAYGLQPCLVAFVLGSIGMAVPSNGGLGPWNIAVMFGLAVYGVSEAQGTAFSVIQWGGQTVMLTILGIFTLFYIFKTAKTAKRK